MRALYIFLFLFAAANSMAQDHLLADKNATKETVNLFKNLDKMAKSGKYLFGHQDDLAYGVNWKYQKNRSDIKDVTGEYPALYGWEIGGIETGKDKNLDGVPFNAMRDFIKKGYCRGGVITISWHGINPLTGKTSWDPAPNTVASVLPGGEKHGVYKSQLDKVAAFLQSLKTKKGIYIPVLFRPFHELTGDWFWWGTKYTTPQQYKDLFRLTVDYLKNEKGLHHLIYVYNAADRFTTSEDFLESYPGDDYADVLSFDQYQYDDPKTSDKFAKEVNSKLTIISAIAERKNKLVAFAETGYEAVPYEHWWTNTLTNAIGNNKIAYVMAWRNHGFQKENNKMHYYTPFKGQLSAPDFVNYYKSPRTVFQKEAKRLKLYK